MNHKIVVMGILGSGKSTLGQALARLHHARFIEGDTYHLASSRKKMRDGIGLDDADFETWIEVLASIMADETGSVVLSCSALKRSCREKLREHVRNLKFVFLDVAPSIAMQRVTAQTAHEFPATLVFDQFKLLESPEGELNVLTVQASQVTELQLDQISAWLGALG